MSCYPTKKIMLDPTKLSLIFCSNPLSQSKLCYTKRVYYTLMVWQFKSFLSVSWWQGCSQDFSKGGGGGYTGSNNIVMAFLPRNLVGCLLKKRLTKGGGSRAPQDPPSYALGWVHSYLSCSLLPRNNIISEFGLEEKGQKAKAVCGLQRTNYGGLQNVRPPIIDPLPNYHICFY